MRPMMTVVQLAEVLGVQPNTLRGWVRSGTVPCVRLSSGCIRFDAQDIMDMLDARRSAPGRKRKGRGRGRGKGKNRGKMKEKNKGKGEDRTTNRTNRTANRTAKQGATD